MLKKINDLYKQIYQTQVSNKDALKRKSEENRVLGKKIRLCKKKLMTNKFQKKSIANQLRKDMNKIKEKTIVEKIEIRFNCLMLIIKKLKIKFDSISSEMELELCKLFKILQDQDSLGK